MNKKGAVYFRRRISEANQTACESGWGNFQENLYLLCETSLETDPDSNRTGKRPDVVVIDSIQTMYNEESGIGAGERFAGAGIYECVYADWQKV